MRARTRLRFPAVRRNALVAGITAVVLTVTLATPVHADPAVLTQPVDLPDPIDVLSESLSDPTILPAVMHIEINPDGSFPIPPGWGS